MAMTWRRIAPLLHQQPSIPHLLRQQCQTTRNEYKTAALTQLVTQSRHAQLQYLIHISRSLSHIQFRINRLFAYLHCKQGANAAVLPSAKETTDYKWC